MKSFLEQQHNERDASDEEIATFTIESVGCSDLPSEINKIIERDVSKIIKFLENNSNGI